MMSKWTVPCAAVVLAFALPACGAAPDAKAPAAKSLELKTEDEKTIYALGLFVSSRFGNFSDFDLSEAELEILKSGISDAVLSREPRVDLGAYGPKIQALVQSRQGAVATKAAAAAEAEKKAAQPFLEKAAAEKGAVRKPSGLIYTEIVPGTGESPKATDKVKANYTGTLIDGTGFDSSAQHGGPAGFKLDQVIPCWTEGLQLMKVGGKSKLVCPGAIAYGDRQAGPKIKPGSTLVFEVELVEIVKEAPAPAPTPAPAPAAKP